MIVKRPQRLLEEYRVSVQLGEPFERVLQHGSVSLAPEELGITRVSGNYGSAIPSVQKYDPNQKIRLIVT